MEFEWDEAKQLRNMARHDIDFFDADRLFSGPLLIGQARTVSGEERLMATGLLNALYVTVIYTMRGETIRVISMRRSRVAERRAYQALFGG